MPVRHCRGCGRFLPSGSISSHKCGFIVPRVQFIKPHKMSVDYSAIYAKTLSALNVRTQKHYNEFKIQPATFIGENKIDFLAGNVIKYVVRFDKKNGVEDLQKARHYLDMLIERTEKGTVTP